MAARQCNQTTEPHTTVALEFTGFARWVIIIPNLCYRNRRNPDGIISRRKIWKPSYEGWIVRFTIYNDKDSGSDSFGVFLVARPSAQEIYVLGNMFSRDRMASFEAVFRIISSLRLNIIELEFSPAFLSPRRAGWCRYFCSSPGSSF